MVIITKHSTLHHKLLPCIFSPVYAVFTPTEPSTPPQNVQATAFSSTQIMVTWDEVPAIEQNGIIIIFEVRFDPLQLTDVLMTEYRNTTDMSVVLTGLQEYVEYNISVRAYTSVGPGPLREDVTERTFEDRELIALLLIFNNLQYA